MLKKPGIFFFLLFILTAIAGFSTKQSGAENTNVNKKKLVLKTFHLPHAELERPQTSSVVFGHAQGHRTINFSIHTGYPVLRFFLEAVSKTKTSKKTFPSKEYLYYIYPSHNFW